jgi:aminoglycoside phosphotransferase (APT) family kinase protein
MDLLDLLRSDGVVKSPHATLTPLTGGVSSEIYRVDDGDDVFVVKRALAKLKVQQEWLADVGRNANEYHYLRYVSDFLPHAVPRPLTLSLEHGYFTMEYLGQGFANWKQQLLAGEGDLQTARTAGQLLAAIHKRSADDPVAAAAFDTLANFEQLRIDPYLLSTAWKHPDLAYLFQAEAARLRESKQVLVHGDFSPKNILVSKDRLVIVDCEVAWYGDAAFDVAFLMNHLILKQMVNTPVIPKAAPGKMAVAVWETYRMAGGVAKEADVVRLILMLRLARIDGKSPVEYLSEDQRQMLRQRTRDKLSIGLWQMKYAYF